MAGRKGKQSVRDMVLSLGLIGIVAGFIYVFIPKDDSEPPLERVDYRVELLTARRAATYPVAAPEGLPTEWKATSVRFRGADFDAWHLGFHDPDGEYVAIEQSTQKPVTFIGDTTQGAEETNVTQRIGEKSWKRYKGEKYDALVLREKNSTTVVTGTASFAKLTKMAESLRTS
ncbi:DUF4245 domain-containing protein [Streptomyces sp. NPDC057621]|uniref:DUF4245 domain-containing protein n=2 Tax=Streptomyces TaxID=1883 RepID=A0A2P8PZF1_9ACTN|nr:MULTISPECIES: DUF4245 domain-containing protein [Streptomyces]MBQ0846737.1 DUF4245 domain-containing protein [Streptomyces liliiviolaceus]PSM39378.1 DUF4245 domain-containing protein [Streptomyces dioscori]